MRLTFAIDGIKETQAALLGFSDRRMAAAAATALTRTAVEAKAGVQAQMPGVFDRPDPYTVNSIFIKPATAQTLEAEIGFKDSASVGGRIPASRYLLPEIQGGARPAKAFERALQAAGHLQRGRFAVPASGALLDQYGNVDRKQLSAILSQLRTGSKTKPLAAGRKGIAAQRKAGGHYFIKRNKAGQSVGIFLRDFTGRAITPVFVFTRPPTYEARFDFAGIVARIASERLGPQLTRAINDSAIRLGQRG